MKRVVSSFFLLTPLLFSCSGGGQNGSSGAKEDSGKEEISSSPSGGRYVFGKTIEKVDLPSYDGARSGVGYEIFVGSFADSNGDGIGDLNGIKNHLDYLSSLGITYLWLTPIYPSPTYHHYDVMDYFSVSPDFGTLEDFSSLCIEAKKRGIDVILDMVLNHASIKGEWFNASLNDFAEGYDGEDSYKDDFVFSLTAPTGKSSKYYSTTAKNGKRVYYEANFDSAMPEFNLNSEKLRGRHRQILDFWLNAGASGFRFDGVYYYYYQSDVESRAYCKKVFEYVRSKKSDAYMVAEVWPSVWPANLISSYTTTGMNVFDFPNSVTGDSSFVTYATSSAKAGVVFSEIEYTQSKQSEGTEPVFFLSNHDQDRLRGYFSKYKDEAERLLKRKLAASYYLLTPGTPFVYYGEEIDLGGIRGTSSTDANRRLHFIWDGNKTDECKDPVGSSYEGDQASVGALEAIKDSSSLASHYASLASWRKKYPFFRNGTYKRLSGSTLEDGKTAREAGVGLIEYGGEAYVLIHNAESSALTINLPEDEQGRSYSYLDSLSPTGVASQLEGSKITLGACSSTLLKLVS